MEEQWRQRSDRMVAQTEDRWKRKYSDLQDEYQQLQGQLSTANSKVCKYSTKQPPHPHTLTPSHPHTHTRTHTQIDILKRQDTSDQLRDAKEQLSSLREEHTRMMAQLSQAQGREEALRAQMVEGEGRWRERMQEVEQVREEGWQSMRKNGRCTSVS